MYFGDTTWTEHQGGTRAVWNVCSNRTAVNKTTDINMYIWFLKTKKMLHFIMYFILVFAMSFIFSDFRNGRWLVGLEFTTTPIPLLSRVSTQ